MDDKLSLYWIIGIIVLALLAVVFVIGLTLGRATAEPGFIGWQWDSSGPGIEMVPYTDILDNGRQVNAKQAQSMEDIDGVRITVRNWDIRYREGTEGEGFLLYDGESLWYTGPLESLWLKPVAFHPPEPE